MLRHCELDYENSFRYVFVLFLMMNLIKSLQFAAMDA